MTITGLNSLDTLSRFVRTIYWSTPLALQLPIVRWKSRLIFERRGVAFAHIPRTGGSSICDRLYGGNIGHAIFDRPSLLRRDLPIFAVVRHPEDRFLSAYYFFKQGGTPRMPVRIQSRAVANLPIDYVASNLPLLSWVDMCLWPQSTWLRISGIKIIKFETLSERNDFPTLNALDARVAKTEPLISNGSKKALQSYYRRDYEIYGSISPSASLANYAELLSYLSTT